MLFSNPSRDGALVDAQPFSGDFLGAEVGNQALEDIVHVVPPYGNSHIVDYGNADLQQYGCARNTRRMEFKDRLKAARKYAKLNQDELAKRSGLTQTSISDLERGKSKGTSFVAQIARVCGVDTLWLAEGRGVMVPGENSGEPATESASAADTVLKMLAKAGKLTAEGRQRILSAVDEVSDKPAASNVITADFSRPAPVGDEIRIAHYDVQGAMGGGKLVHDYPEMFRDVTVSQRHLRELGVTYRDPSHLKIISGDGQSMAPIIQHLDPMISDVSIREFTGDGIYAFTWQGLFYIKSLQVADEDHFLMVSADEKLYPPKKIRIDDTYIQARILLVWNAKRV